MIDASWAEIGVGLHTVCSVRDLWNRSWLPNADAGSGVSALVQSHDVVALKLTPVRNPGAASV